MWLIYAEIEIINGEDLGLARRNVIDQEQVRKITVSALVDSGSYMMAINENIQEYLQLPVVERRKAQLANGQPVECDVVAPIELRFKNRRTTCHALVLPGNAEPLLGAIPLEDMDVLIHPLHQELIVNPDHPDMTTMRL